MEWETLDNLIRGCEPWILIWNFKGTNEVQSNIFNMLTLQINKGHVLCILTVSCYCVKFELRLKTVSLTS